MDEIIEVLSDRPEMADRIHSILKIADEPLSSGKIRRADEVEAMLVEELRKLGNETLTDWGNGADGSVGADLRKEGDDVNLREKKL